MFQYWKDWRLQWEPAEYGGITELRIPAERLWKPDIVPYNRYRYTVALTYQDCGGRGAPLYTSV